MKASKITKGKQRQVNAIKVLILQAIENGRRMHQESTSWLCKFRVWQAFCNFSWSWNVVCKPYDLLEILITHLHTNVFEHIKVEWHINTSMMNTISRCMKGLPQMMSHTQNMSCHESLWNHYGFVMVKVWCWFCEPTVAFFMDNGCLTMRLIVYA